MNDQFIETPKDLLDIEAELRSIDERIPAIPSRFDSLRESPHPILTNILEQDTQPLPAQDTQPLPVQDTQPLPELPISATKSISVEDPSSAMGFADIKAQVEEIKAQVDSILGSIRGTNPATNGDTQTPETTELTVTEPKSGAKGPLAFDGEKPIDDGDDKTNNETGDETGDETGEKPNNDGDYETAPELKFGAEGLLAFKGEKPNNDGDYETAPELKFGAEGLRAVGI